MLVPINVNHPNKIPTKKDYEALKSSVISFFDSVQNFYKHEGIIDTFIRNEMQSVVKVYCYLRNKSETLSGEERSIYVRLNKELEKLKSYDVNIDEFVERIPETTVNFHSLRLR